MAGTLIGSNTTIKISAAVSATTTTTGTLYTCAANSYAILNIHSVGAISYTIASRVYTMTAGQPPVQIYVGPSQAVAVTVNGSSATVSLTGVEFINTP